MRLCDALPTPAPPPPPPPPHTHLPRPPPLFPRWGIPNLTRGIFFFLSQTGHVSLFLFFFFFFFFLLRAATMIFLRRKSLFTVCLSWLYIYYALYIRLRSNYPCLYRCLSVCVCVHALRTVSNWLRFFAAYFFFFFFGGGGGLL